MTQSRIKKNALDIGPGENQIRLVPAGVILPFPGDVAPPGFLLCDGDSHNYVTEPEKTTLFGVIGYKFGGAGNVFDTPDLRGRGIVGLDNMGGTGANRITASWADGPSGSSAAGGDQDTVVVAHTHSDTFSVASNSTGITLNNSATGISIIAVGNHVHSMSGASAVGHTHHVPRSFTENNIASGAFKASGELHTHNTDASASAAGNSGNGGGHGHSVTDPMHVHGINDGGHIHTLNGSVSSTGSTGTGQNVQPSMAMNWIIAL